MSDRILLESGSPDGLLLESGTYVIILEGTATLVVIPNSMMMMGYGNAGASAAVSSLLTGILGYWKLDEASGTRNDSVGSNHLSVRGGTDESSTGKISLAANFRFDNSSFALDKNGTNLFLGSDDDFTVCCWMRPNQFTAPHGGLCLEDVFNIGFNLWGNGTTDWAWEVGNGTSSTVLHSSSGYSINTWYFIVAWHDKTADKIYIQVNDGTPDETAWSGGTLATCDTWSIGNDIYGGAFNGLIDEVGLWNRTLTSGERTSLYNSGTGITHPFS